MKTFSRFFQLVAAVLLLLSGLELMAEQPGTVPPRGKAYGYYMKDGTYVLFVYEYDGTRTLSLSKARPKSQFQVTCTEDMRTWQVLGTMTVQSDGTAYFVDAAPSIPYRYYQVIRIP